MSAIKLAVFPYPPMAPHPANRQSLPARRSIFRPVAQSPQRRVTRCWTRLLGGIRLTPASPQVRKPRAAMVRIAITQAAFEAIAKTLPLGSVGYENKVNAKGEHLIWLEPSVVDRLRSMRGPGESYSDVILRLAEEG
jgi:hypothetical protein